jgi:hypothetical protein
MAGYAVGAQMQAVTQYVADPPIRGSIPEAGPCPLEKK